ncbi:MAG: 50S ribosomal protein L3, partial [Candidatus Helarchaeota archaeon]
MGHRKLHAPRHGSLAYYPRKRAKLAKGKIKHWPQSQNVGFLGFGGFKAGMTHIAYIEKHKSSPYKDQEIFCPVTIIETPPMLMYGIRAYKKDLDGLKVATEILAENLENYKHLSRKILIPKNYNFKEKTKRFKEIVKKGGIVELRGLFASQPHLTSVPRKKPDLFEIKIGGKSVSDALEFALESLGKEIRARDIFKEGQYVDIASVSKGKGFQGPVKRFRIHRLQHKSRKAVRAVACIGPWHPARVMWTVPRAGQMGYHQRIEYNKQVLKISEKGEEVTPVGGFIDYGVIKNDYIMIKGSIPGAKKRFVRLRFTIRNKEDIE